MRRLLMLAALLLLSRVAIAAPDPNTLPYPSQTALSLNHPSVFMVPQVSSPPIQFQNQGTPLGVSFTFNCSTGLTCSFVSGVMTVSTSGGGGTINTCATTNALAIYTAATTLGCGNADFTYATDTLTMGASGLFDMHTGGNASLRIPTVAAFSTTAGVLQIDTTPSGANGNPLMFGNGSGAFFAVMAGGNTVSSTSCTSKGVTAVSAIASPTCGGLSAFVTGSDYTNATAGATNVTGLSFSLSASTNYAISCKLIYQGSATTTTMALTSTGPASPTKVTGQTEMTTTAGSGAVIFTQAFDGTTFGFAAGPPSAIVTTATDLQATLDVGIVNGTTAGTWQLQATNGTGTLTIRAGSFCTIQ